MYICMVLKDVLINFLSLAAAVDAYVSSSIDYFFICLSVVCRVAGADWPASERYRARARVEGWQFGRESARQNSSYLDMGVDMYAAGHWVSFITAALEQDSIVVY